MTVTDPILLQVYRHRFAGVAEEMGITLQRTAHSPNIKERLDFSCAFFDHRGAMVAQAAHIPAHLGAMPASCAAALEAYETWYPGDVVMLNDPYAGGNHLPDITMVSPVFPRNGRTPAFFVASRAHHADVGGMTPGSLPLSTELYQEGIIIPPVRLVREGVLNKDLLRVFLRNVRTPDERRGDLAAQRSAHTTGTHRLIAMMEEHGEDEVRAYARHLISYSERATRTEIASWPDGDYAFEDYLVLPDGAMPCIRVRATIEDDSITFDFTGTDPEMESSLNTVIAVTQSACYYAVRCLQEEEIPVNAGCFAPVTVNAPPGSLVHSLPPAAVAGGNVETSQRITDVVFGALAEALPNKVAAAGQGTMNNLTIGGRTRDGKPFAYYETIGGGMGAAPDGGGLSGVHVHMSNTRNTPVEALEMDFPFRIMKYALAEGSGGHGLHCGGEGIIREYQMLAPVTVTMLSERRQMPAWGLHGGQPGARGSNRLCFADGSEEELPGHFTRRLQAGDSLRIVTPGGGGWGIKPES